MTHAKYQSPLNERYAGPEMQQLFSEEAKFRSWRDFWIVLAEVEKELGLPISEEQIQELKKHREDIPYEAAKAYERDLRHDVMAHVHAYGDQCPLARPIIHWGATSCYVCDNTDLRLYREAIDLLLPLLQQVISNLRDFALRYKAQATLGFTHFQPAQPVTVGKRACLWLQDLLSDVEELKTVRERLRLLGCKGTTGTQASFMTLFDGDEEKCRRLDEAIAERMGFPGVYPVSGQTYSRKVDTRILNALSSIAQTAHKFANDLRLLQNLKELEEPFGAKQIGSSAMAYKRNPMRSERMTSLARYLMTLPMNAAQTAAEQWLERTLDDSANKRIVMAEAFLAADAILCIFANVSEGMVVYPKVIEKRLEAELPFMATETLLMEAVKRGGDRQALHERIRIHSMDAARQIKEEGGRNDLLERLAEDETFPMTLEEMRTQLHPLAFVGRSVSQVEEFIQEVVDPYLQSAGAGRKKSIELSV